MSASSPLPPPRDPTREELHDGPSREELPSAVQDMERDETVCRFCAPDGARSGLGRDWGRTAALRARDYSSQLIIYSRKQARGQTNKNAREPHHRTNTNTRQKRSRKHKHLS